MHVGEMSDRIMHKIANRQYVMDWAPGSWDRRVANARAWRIFLRLRGERITFVQALHS